MATVALNENDFQKAAQDEGILLIDFWADWCGPCHQFAPIYEDASERHPDVTFGKVDVDENPGLAGQFGVRSIPTLAAIRDGVVVFSQPGVLPGQALDELIGKVGELDMDEIHAQIAAAEKDESES